MFCYECGEENPDEAKYCKNCGALLKKEKAKKVEVIEQPTQNYQRQNTASSENSTLNKNDNSQWLGCCCLGLIVVFILSALLSIF